VGIQLTSTGWKLNWLDALTNNAVENAASAATYLAINRVGLNTYGMSFDLMLNPLDGCVMDVNLGTGNARVFWRFGVLMVVDKLAHNIMRALPVANAQEQAAVTNLMLGQK
jgi:hypothetical protein